MGTIVCAPWMVFKERVTHLRTISVKIPSPCAGDGFSLLSHVGLLWPHEL